MTLEDQTAGEKKFLPIFPLPMVLLPFETLPLHIFEPRYREMLRDIKEKDNSFGLAYLHHPPGYSGRPDAGSIGCVANVIDVHMLEDGRSNIMVTGDERFRIVEYVDRGDLYNFAEIEIFNDEPDESPELVSVYTEVYNMFFKITKNAFEMGGKAFTEDDFRITGPEHLSFIAASTLRSDEDLKYKLLKTTNTLERLTTIREILVQVADQFEDSAKLVSLSKTNGHSKKDIPYN